MPEKISPSRKIRLGRDRYPAIDMNVQMHYVNYFDNVYHRSSCAEVNVKWYFLFVLKNVSEVQ